MLYERTFRRAQRTADRLLSQAIPKRPTEVRDAVRLALRNQSPTEYPYIFRNAFSGSEPQPIDVDTLAAAVHLIQTSTFVTDDVFDKARERNGNPTMVAHGGVNVAIAGAQLLQWIGFATFASTATRFRNAGFAAAILARAVTRVYRGQYLDLLYSSRSETTRADYYRVIELTTASLFSGVAQCGALLANRDEAEIKALSQFARCYGMALQITDDILDLTDHTTGKTFGSDLICRRMRLPLIIALETGSEPTRRILRRFLRSRTEDNRTVTDIARTIDRSGGVAGALRIARNYRDRSLRCLLPLPPSQSKNCLVWLSESLLAAQELE